MVLVPQINNMNILPYKLQKLSYVVEHTKTVQKVSPFEMISEAPLWLRLLSRGRYCAYKNNIYVPSFHLELVSSKHDADRTLATAKLLPWLMLLHDAPNNKVCFILAIASLLSVKYQMHYFLYEFLFLKATKHPFYDVVSIGFMTTRRKWFGLKSVSFEEVEAFMQATFDANKPTT